MSSRTHPPAFVRILASCLILAAGGGPAPTPATSPAEAPPTPTLTLTLTPADAARLEVTRDNYLRLAFALDDVYTDPEVKRLRHDALRPYVDAFATASTRPTTAARRAGLAAAEARMADSRTLLEQRWDADRGNAALRSEVDLALTEMAFRRGAYDVVGEFAPKYIGRAAPGRVRAQLYHFYY